MYAILTSGNVLAVQCRCIAGKREAYNLVAALLFYIQDIKRIEVNYLPLDNTVTDHQQQWHVPPKRSVAPQPNGISQNSLWEESVHKAPAAHPAPQQNPALTSLKLVEKVSHVYPGSGLTHFWTLPGMQGGDSGEFISGQPAAEPETTMASCSWPGT